MSVYNKHILALTVACLSTSLAHAQIIEGILFGIGSQLVNKKLAESERKEYGAAKIVFNVYHVGDGPRQSENSPLSIWDPSTGTAAAWDYGMELVPVLGVNESSSPYEVKWSISDERGPLMVQQYNKVHGGARDRGGKAKDNRGYQNPVFSLRLRELPRGVLFLTGSWGKGKSVTVQLVNLDVTSSLVRLQNDEELRRQFYGAGHSTFPVAPIAMAAWDGQAHYFMSPAEIEPYLQRLNQAAQPINPTSTNLEPRGTANATAWNGEFRLGCYQGTEPSDFQKQSLRARMPHLNQTAEIPLGRKLVILLTSQTPFEVAVINKNGEAIGKGVAAPENGVYELTLNIELDNDLPQVGVVVTSQNQTTTLQITRT